MSQDELWEDTIYPSNLAVIAGRNDLIILDADDHESVETLKNFLTGLGIEQVGTQTRRQHWWIKTIIPSNMNKKGSKLIPPLKGDTKFKHGYAMATPSIVDEYKYIPIGHPANIKTVHWTDIRELFNFDEETESIVRDLDRLPIPVIQREPKEIYKELTRLLTIAPKGEKIYLGDKSWESRSEAAFSIMLHFLLCGMDSEEIKELLDIQDKSDHWYEYSINKAIQEICNKGYSVFR